MRTVTTALLTPLCALLASLAACSDPAAGTADSAATDAVAPADGASDVSVDAAPDATSSPDVAPDVAAADATADVTPPDDAAPDTLVPADTLVADTLVADAAPDTLDVAPPEPPCAALAVTEGATVAPPLTLHLSGLASTGDVATWRWSLVSAPSGSVSVLRGADTGTPTFEAALGGAYVFRLDVLDAHGAHACDAAEVTVQATPTAPIHLELVWDDNTADPSVEVGADLDLHVFDPDAEGLDVNGDGDGDGWFDAVLDCAWHNPTPIWPAANGVASPAPRLLRRDDAGYGPEVIAVAAPTPDRDYVVGFHVWDDTDADYLAPTEIRVWIDGVLKNKPTFQVPVSNHALERVMTVRWPSGQLGFPFVTDGHFIPTSPSK